MDKFTNIFHASTGTYIIIACLLIIILIQFLLLRRLRKLFRRLSDVYYKGEKLNYLKLVERIIFSRELYTSSASDEVVNMIHNYIRDLFKDLRVFIHVTNEKEIADSILKEGFKYSENFHKSSEEVTDNIVDLKYKLQIYKNYGKFVIIIGIPLKLNKVTKPGELKLDKDIFVEYGISEYNPANELSYKLPSRFVRGYVDTGNMQIVNNELFKINK